MNRSASVLAPAKVNLCLNVLHRRPDGYHELETVFQAIDVADDVHVSLGGVGVGLDVEGAALGPQERNLAYRAAVRLREETGITGGLRITLLKRIPVGAGLGGGSSDAAAVLKSVAALVGIPPSDPLLHRIALELGSDVPFFLSEGALAVGRSRGEVLEPLPPLPEAHLVVVSPPVHVSTAWAYEALGTLRERAGVVASARCAPPQTWGDFVTAAHNDFQDLVASRHPEVVTSLEALDSAGARRALLSGSGSSSFGLFDDRSAAVRAAAALSDELGWACRAVKTLSALPDPRVA